MKSIDQQHHFQHKGLGLAFRLILPVLLCAMALPAWAQSKSPRIGVVDVEQITRRSRSVQDAVKQAEDQVRPQQDKVEAKIREMQTLRQNLSDQRTVIKPEDAESNEGKLRALREEVLDLQNEIDKRFARIQSEVMEPEVKRIMKTVDEIARREGYDLVVRSEAVLFSSDLVNITPLVIQSLDKQSGAESGAGSSAKSSDSSASSKTEKSSSSNEDKTAKASSKRRSKKRSE